MPELSNNNRSTRIKFQLTLTVLQALAKSSRNHR